MDFVNEEKPLELIKNPCLAILSEDQNNLQNFQIPTPEHEKRDLKSKLARSRSSFI